MALVRRSVYTVTLTVEDRDRDTSTLQFYVDIGNSIAEIELALANFIIPRTQALINGIIRSWTISTMAEETDPAVIAVEASDVQRKGVFSFDAANGASYVLSVPSLNNAFVLDTTNNILTNDPAVQAFINLLISPDVLALVRPRTYLGSDIIRFNKAYKRHRNSKEG